MIDGLGLVGVLRGAIVACEPRAAVRAALAGDAAIAAPVRLIAIGKAARPMARGARDALGDAIVEGLVVTPDGAPEVDGLAGLTLRSAAHPVPDARSEAAGRAALALAGRVGAGETLIALISGGASALAAVPRPGMNLAEKSAAIAALARTGAPIDVLNRARRERSAIKGGRLAAACPGRVVTLVVSDVPGDDPAVVGSGPTVPGKPGDRVRVVAGLATLRAEAAALVRRSARAAVEPGDLAGDVAAVAERVLAAADALAPGQVWIGGGEWTVALGDGPVGEGGRASALALRLARALRGRGDLAALVGASDGVDGASPRGAALVDGRTWDALAAAGVDPEAALATHDSGRALAAAGALFDSGLAPGPTGVNHADLVLVARAR